MKNLQSRINEMYLPLHLNISLAYLNLNDSVIR